MALFDFSKIREERKQIEAEKRQLGYEKEQIQTQSSFNPSSEANLQGMIESRSDLQKWQQLLKEDFDTLLAQLGYWEDNNGSIKPTKGGIIICNENCINYLKSIMTPFYFRSVSITKLDKIQINRIMLDTMQSVIIDLSAHMKEYGIKDISGIKRIEMIIENIILPILCRSIDGFTKREDNAARRINENANPLIETKEGLFKKMVQSIT